MKDMKLSVIICTKGNRWDALNTCIRSIRSGSMPANELILVNYRKNVKKIVVPGMKFITVTVDKKGLGFARNEGIKAATGDVLIFTDDDCIADRNWISHIVKNFAENPSLAMVTGKVLPYEGHRKSGYKVPSVVLSRKKRLFSSFGSFVVAGSGNNMAIRKTAITSLGGFQTCLGSGAVGKSADDIEFMIRLLTHNKTIYYDPSVVIHHDRWLDRNTFDKQILDYICGNMACFSYFFRKGYRASCAPMVNSFIWIIWELRHSVKQLFLGKFRLSGYFFSNGIVGIYSVIRGCLVGFGITEKPALNN